LAERIVNEAGNLGQLQDIMEDARSLLDRAVDAQHQRAQIAAAQDERALQAGSSAVTVDSWSAAPGSRTLPPANNGYKEEGYTCADCEKPFSAPDEDDDGECYCPNCGVLLTDENCLKAEDLDSLPPKPRPTLLGVLVEHLVGVRSP
jgi:hypothetical protein